MLKKIGLTVLLAALSGVASAGDSCKPIDIFGFEFNPCPPSTGHGSNPAPAPEIDPASAMAGLTLALGGLTVLRGRRTKNSKQ